MLRIYTFFQFTGSLVELSRFCRLVLIVCKFCETDPLKFFNLFTFKHRVKKLQVRRGNHFYLWWKLWLSLKYTVCCAMAVTCFRFFKKKNKKGKEVHDNIFPLKDNDIYSFLGKPTEISIVSGNTCKMNILRRYSISS